jgi:dihydrofolate synthase/folylpolyglutamate synthase
MRFSDAVADLDARQPTRMVPDLDRIRALVDLLDHPQRTYPGIHVTGTNGKTTTTRLIARLLCAHGLATGAYTSPHLRSVTERIALCEEDISEEEFAETYTHLDPYLREVDRRGERVTYFETLTALSFLWFADKPVDAAVFEVGMGGTWDATNVIDAKVAVFCSIDLDHPELGSTVEEVAREKAGIIKEGATVVIQEPSPAVLATVETRAVELGCPTRVRGHDYWITGEQAVGGQRLSVRTKSITYEDLFLPLFGRPHAGNAATAVVAAEEFLGGPLKDDAVREALEDATSPGRLEVVARHPLVVLDGAHNPDAARRLPRSLGEAFAWDRLYLVLGVLETKDVAGIVAALASLEPAAVYACANSNPKSLSADDMAAACRDAGLPVSAYGSVTEALDAAEETAAPSDLIVGTGSLYTVADARPRYVT